MAKPIFIVGNQRSGTTWLANILCHHSKIRGVQVEPFGIRESHYFNRIEGYFGNLKDDNNFIHFIETFGSSDYFRITGVDKDLFYQKRPTTYLQSFLLLMDTFANEENAEFWLEKTPEHSLFLNKISKYFKEAKFIGIKRNTIDIIKSSLRRQNVLRNNIIKRLGILRRLLQHYIYDKHLNKFNSTKNRIFMINYESLREIPQTVLREVCIFLELDFEPSLLKERYQPNTSFSNFNKQDERARILNSFDLRLIKWCSTLLNIIPYSFYRILYIIQLNIRRKRFTSGYWKIFKQEKFK